MLSPRGPEGQNDSQQNQSNNKLRNFGLVEVGTTIFGTAIAANSLKNSVGESVPLSFEGIKNLRITAPVAKIFEDPSVIVSDPAIIISPIGLEITRESESTTTLNLSGYIPRCLQRLARSCEFVHN